MDDDDDEGCRWIFQVPIVPIDRVLRRKGLRRIIGYPYTAGDCLFDSILYLLRDEGPYFRSSVSLRRAMVGLYISKVKEKDPKAMEWLDNFLVLENLQEIHPELDRMDIDEKEAADVYLCRMKFSAARGGLWGDHFCAFWLQELLQRPIRIWLADTGKILGGDDDPVGDDGDLGGDLRLVYHSRYHGFSFSHYEPVVVFQERIGRFRGRRGGGGGGGGGRGGGDRGGGDRGESRPPSMVEQKRVVVDDLADEVLEEETETETETDEDLFECDGDDDDDEPPPLRSTGSSQGGVADRVPGQSEEEEDDGREEEQDGFDRDRCEISSQPDELVSVSGSVDLVEAAEALKDFSTEARPIDRRERDDDDQLHPKRLKTDCSSFSPRGQRDDQESTPTTTTTTSSSGSSDTKVVEADCGHLSNCEVLHRLRKTGGACVSVRDYLLQTPAASQSIGSLRKLSREPIIRRLTPLERIQVANLRPDLVQLYLIIQNIEERFSNDEIGAMVATVDRFLAEPQRF